MYRAIVIIITYASRFYDASHTERYIHYEP